MKRFASTLSGAMSWSPRKATVFSAVVVVFTGLIALAAIPDLNGVIRGCYGANGLLRVVNSSAECRNGETALQWNQVGPKGDPGSGTSKAYVNRLNAYYPLYSNFNLPVLSRTLPAGRYTVNATLSYAAQNTVTCRITPSPSGQDDVSGPVGVDNMALSGVISDPLNPIEVQLVCASGSASVLTATMTAVPFDSIDIMTE